MTVQTIALFGATGQIGTAILRALLSSESQFRILQIIPPGAEARAHRAPNLDTKVINLSLVTVGDLSHVLQGVDVVISALNGKALEAQAVIQDAAWDARVKRFYPSEYGMHHIYRKPGDTYGYLHPIWNIKAKCNEQVVRHPAISSGEMTYTIIGCGDIFNQPREKVWCPWTQTDVNEYTLPIVGNPEAKIDFTHLDDLGRFVVKTIHHPESSENTTVNFVSDHISYSEIAGLLEKYSGKRVWKNVMAAETAHHVLKNPDDAPVELKSAPSAFPVDFWFLVRGVQGEGRFWRPKGGIHNSCFPEVDVKTFEKFFREIFGDYYI